MAGREISSGDLMYSVVIITNNTILCISKLLRDWILKGLHHKRNDNYVMGYRCSLMRVVVIMLQYLNASNQHVVHLKLTECLLITINKQDGAFPARLTRWNLTPSILNVFPCPNAKVPAMTFPKVSSRDRE